MSKRKKNETSTKDCQGHKEHESERPRYRYRNYPEIVQQTE